MLVAFALAFLTTAAFWWLYFDYVARIAERRLELAENRTQLARDAYTYLHVVLIAGVIVAAVGDELVIAHPTDELPGPELAAVIAGPALYLLGHVALRLRMTGTVSVKRLAGALACLAVAPVGLVAPALVVVGAPARGARRRDRRRAPRGRAPCRPRRPLAAGSARRDPTFTELLGGS